MSELLDMMPRPGDDGYNIDKIFDLIKSGLMNESNDVTKNNYLTKLYPQLHRNYMEKYDDVGDLLILLERMINDNNIGKFILEIHYAESIMDDLVNLINSRTDGIRKSTDKRILKYLKQICDVMEVLCKSKNIEIDLNIPQYDILNEILERLYLIRACRSSMIDTPKFWAWVEQFPNINKFLNPNINKFLNPKKIDDKKTNSKKTMNRFYLHLHNCYEKNMTTNYVNDIEKILKIILEKYSDDEIEYISNSFKTDWGSLHTELIVFTTLVKEFPDIKVGSNIPNSSKCVDFSFDFEGVNYLVEVYTANDSLKDQSSVSINDEIEWYITSKRQLKPLKEQDCPTIYIAKVPMGAFAGFDLTRDKYQTAICAAMPNTSELVIMQHNDKIVSVYSIRNGRMSIENTDLGKNLKNMFESNS